MMVKGVLQCFNVFWSLLMGQHGQSERFLSLRAWHGRAEEASCCFVL